jgi:hypothetical protein
MFRLKITLFLLLTSAITFSGCKKEKKGCTDSSAINYDATAEETGNCCTYNGRAIFWNHLDDEYCEVKVWFDGVYVDTITYDFSSAPQGGTQGCVTYIAKPRTYNVVAKEEDCDGDEFF